MLILIKLGLTWSLYGQKLVSGLRNIYSIKGLKSGINLCPHNVLAPFFGIGLIELTVSLP